MKNEKSVVVPNSGGVHGIKIAAILCILSNNPLVKLEILADITDNQRTLTKQLLDDQFCDFTFLPIEEQLFISVTASKGRRECRRWNFQDTYKFY